MLEIMKPEEFAQVYSLMEESFPIDEFRPFHEQKQLLQNKDYCIYVLHHPDTVRAFLAVWQFDDFTYIEHFAVAPALRGLGTGSMILKEAARIFKKQLCLEVELPQTDSARRRIEFYKRNGFVLNSYPYMQPPVSSGRKEIPLMIMTAKEAVSEERFENIKSALYRKVYRVYTKSAV